METLKKTELVPSNDDFTLIEELKDKLKEYLLNSDSVSDPVRAGIEAIISDKFRLLKFLRGKKRNVDKAFNSLLRYAQVSGEVYPELFPDVIPPSVRLCFEKEIISLYRHVDGQGRIVVEANASRWDPSLISADDLITAARIISDALMDYSALYDHGLVIVANAEGAKLAHARQYTIPAIIKFVTLFWQAYPIPIKGLYYVKVPWFAKSVYTLLKPFLPKKLRKRLIVTPELKELHERLPVNILPQSLGGNLTEEEAMSLSILDLPM